MRLRLHYLALPAVMVLAACGNKPAAPLPGYAEADYVRLAAPISGTLTRLHLNRGDKPPALAPILFRYVVVNHNPRITTLTRGHDGQNTLWCNALIDEIAKGLCVRSCG